MAFGGASRTLAPGRSPPKLPCEARPALVVIALQRRSAQREIRGAKHEPRLEHKGERVGDLLRTKLGARGALESRAVGAVRRKGIVQRGTAGHEALRLRVIN